MTFVSPTAASSWRVDLAGALLVTLAILLVQAWSGFPTLADYHDDNDSLLRLVEIRDLIGGQSWFDLHQYRMGPPGGFVMHWSRLVDAPIAAIVLAGTSLTGSVTTGETIALIVWPTLLFVSALFFLVRSARLFAGPAAQLPALLIGATSLHYIAIFVPGALDHHSLQLVLTLAVVLLLLKACRRDAMALGAAAGAVTALLLAVAMEAAPYVATTGLVVALWCLFDPPRSRRTAAGFGLAFAAMAAMAFFTTVGSWDEARCDAFSLPHALGAAFSGVGLAAIAAASLPLSMPRRLALFAGLGVALAAVVLIVFPQCLADPYAGLDPRLRSWWLDAITEAQPAWAIASIDPAMAAGHYATPIVALVWLLRRIVREGPRRETLLLAAFLAVAFLVSVWQVRGSLFAIPLAVVPLSAFVCEWRQRATASPSTAATLKMAGAWLVSLNVVWSAAAGAVVGALAATGAPAGMQALAASPSICGAAADYDQLAAMPATGVLAVSNLGAPVLRYTPHRVLAGPYHRNVAGNLAALDAFTGPIDAVPALARANGMTLLALCRGNGESQLFAERAPDGLMAALLRGETPDWLELVAGTSGAPLEVYRILP